MKEDMDFAAVGGFVCIVHVCFGLWKLPFTGTTNRNTVRF